MLRILCPVLHMELNGKLDKILSNDKHVSPFFEFVTGVFGKGKLVGEGLQPQYTLCGSTNT